MLRTGLFVSLMLVSLAVSGQKKVQTFTVTRVIKAPAEKVWAVVGEDFGAIANSHPYIVSSEYLNGSLKGGEGAERVCNFNAKGTKYAHEKQIEYDPENYTFKAQMFQVGKLPMNIDYTYAVYKVEPIDANSCRLVFKMNYRTKPAFMGAMAKGRFKKTIARYALAVEHHVRTGEVVNKENFKQIRKKYES